MTGTKELADVMAERVENIFTHDGEFAIEDAATKYEAASLIRQQAAALVEMEGAFNAQVAGHKKTASDLAKAEARNRELEGALGRAQKALKARKAIYEQKRDTSDRLAQDNYTRWDNFNHTVEALEILETEMFPPTLFNLPRGGGEP